MNDVRNTDGLSGRRGDPQQLPTEILSPLRDYIDRE
jgi:hypothetical protein